MRDCSEPGRGGLKEVGDQLGFAVLFPFDGSFFGDDGSVVVGCIASWMTEVACLLLAYFRMGLCTSHTPVSTAIGHVDVLQPQSARSPLSTIAMSLTNIVNPKLKSFL